jgi:hypothetical protein
MKISSLIKKRTRADTEREDIDYPFDTDKSFSGDELSELEQNALLLVSLASTITANRENEFPGYEHQNNESPHKNGYMSNNSVTHKQYRNYDHPEHTQGYETNVYLKEDPYNRDLINSMVPSHTLCSQESFPSPSCLVIKPENSLISYMNPYPGASSPVSSPYYRDQLPIISPIIPATRVKKELPNNRSQHNSDNEEESPSLWNANNFVSKSITKNQRKERNKRRLRTTPEQLKVLEEIYHYEKIPSLSLREELSAKLGMTPRRIQVWFQNKRAKEKRTGKEKQANNNNSTGSDSNSQE